MWGVRASDLRAIIRQEYESGAARLELPYEPPQEYDFRIAFKWKGRSNVDQILAAGGKSFTWGIGTFDNRWNGFSLVGGKMQNENATKRDFKLEEGHEYLSEVQVRKDGLKAFIDGQLAGEWKTDYSDMGTEPFWKLRHERQLGIGVWASEAIFSKIEVREITGAGRLLRGGNAAGAPAPPNFPPPPPPPRKPPL